MLYYHNKDMSVNACRAYFQLANALVVNGADGLTFGGFGSDPARVPRK